MASSPNGESITYSVDGVEKTVLLRSNILCDKNMKKVAAHMKASKRAQRVELINDLKGLPPESTKDAISEIVRSSMDSGSISYEQIFTAIQDADGVALRMVLETSIDGDVDELLDNHPNVIEILTKTIEAGTEVFEAIGKNLSRLEEIGAEKA